MAEKMMNLRGLKCPLPALRVKKMLTMMASGDLIVAECTDPMAAIDIPHLVRQSGDSLEHQELGPDLLTFRIRKN